MTELFLEILNRSIAVSWLIPWVLILRWYLRKYPKWVYMVLWAIIAVRLLCPISLENNLFSVVPNAQPIQPDILTDPHPQISTGSVVVNELVNPILEDRFTPRLGDSINPLQILIPVAAWVWLLGTAAMVLYMAVSCELLGRRLRTAVRLRDNIYQCETISSPFVLGLFRPRIYLPYGLSEGDMAHVLAHEQVHIRRRDHWWKPLSFALLAVHWFNPVLWLCYVLLCRDIELACDEEVIGPLGSADRAAYSEALVRCSVSRKSIAACPLAFGEVGVKRRLKCILKYRAATAGMVGTALGICTGMAICFLSDTPQDSPVHWAQSLHPDAVVSAELWQEDGATHRLTEETTRMLVAQLNHTSHRNVTENRDLEGSTPGWGITLTTEEGVYHLNECITPNADLEMQYRDKQWWIANPKLHDLAMGILQGNTLETRLAPELDAAVRRAILEHNWDDRYLGGIPTASFVPLYTDASEDAVTCYGLARHMVFAREGNSLKELGGSHVPVAVTFERTAEGAYVLREYWEPRDGAYHDDDIRAKFPAGLWPDTQKYVGEQDRHCRLQAEAQEASMDSLLVMDQIEVDLDGDGTMEYCTLADGGTSGLVTLVITARVGGWEGDVKYRESFVNRTDHWDVRFALGAEGLLLRQTDQNGTGKDYEVYVEDGTIRLSEPVVRSDWGLRLSVREVSPVGLTLIFNQSSGLVHDNLMGNDRRSILTTGAAFWLERLVDGRWVALESRMEVFWKTVAYEIPLEDTVGFPCRWGDIYDRLDPGTYRIGKTVLRDLGFGEYASGVFYAEFAIE